MAVHMACVISDLASTCQFKCHTAVACCLVMLFALGISAFFSLAGTIFVLDTIEDSMLGSKKFLLSLLFLIVVIFLYGPRNLIHHVRKRLRVRLVPPPFFWQLSWYIICPLGLVGLMALAFLGRGGTFFRDDVPLWIKLAAVGYEFYYWVIILFFLVQTAVAWKRPTRPRGVWRLETSPDDVENDEGGGGGGGGSDESILITASEPRSKPTEAASKTGAVESTPTLAGGGESVPAVPADSEAPQAAAKDGETTEEPEEDLTLPGEKRRAEAARGAVERIRGLELEPGPDEADLFVRLHAWSRGPPKPPTPSPTPTPPSPESEPPPESEQPPESVSPPTSAPSSPPPPSSSPTPSPEPPPRLPSIDSIQTEYANFLGRQSPDMRARGLPIPAQERIEREGVSRLPWKDEQLSRQFGPNVLGMMSPFTKHGLFGRGRVSPDLPLRRSPEWTEPPRRAASVAAAIPEGQEAEEPPKDVSEDTPSLMNMLRNMKS
ncbi:hypothetical protein FJT64_006021 [Amphibalanus amphitrite]|uniref:Uncharacterized protein n=1 Tax=Amphibalanus amphitrite TaxID=1232801 RepID=A0A6A4W0D6_AMPAM|nr:hypothetical protein FJT64_006021 [Amphibalanus amphitrite]